MKSAGVRGGQVGAAADVSQTWLTSNEVDMKSAGVRLKRGQVGPAADDRHGHVGAAGVRRG